jgi:hypothetical protein
MSFSSLLSACGRHFRTAFARPKRPPQRGRHLHVEELEARQVPTVSLAQPLSTPHAVQPDTQPIVLHMQHSLHHRVGQQFSAVLATFTGPHGIYKAEIDWGDRSLSAGRIVSVPGHKQTLAVLGTHTYHHEGYYPIEVLVLRFTHRV